MHDKARTRSIRTLLFLDQDRTEFPVSARTTILFRHRDAEHRMLAGFQPNLPPGVTLFIPGIQIWYDMFLHEASDALPKQLMLVRKYTSLYR